MSAPTSDVEAEQAVLTHAHERLGAMRARAEQILSDVKAAGGVEIDHLLALARRVTLLADTVRPLCFGRIDEVDGDTWHLGRRHVEDEGGDPLVVEWRAPIAASFYRARPSEPMGLWRRRQIMVDGRRVLAVADDVFRGNGHTAEADEAEGRLRGGDALLAELERARTGEMLDIVATIQAEQDEVIRAPLEGVVAVQGGPGTGKTAIGLHRVAYLLYNHPELARPGVLVLGPSRTFLRYIAQVLPALGEEAVTQVTVEDLVPKVRVRGWDDVDVARIKGDPRMATVVSNALAARRALLEEDVIVTAGLSRVRVPAEQVNEVVGELAARSGPYLAGRAAARARLAGLAYRSWLRSQALVDSDAPARELSAAPELRAALDRVWPSVSARTLVGDLLSSPSRLAQAAAGILDDDEQAAVLRPAAATLGKVRWTRADLALVDEAQALLDGQARTFGHVVVDEAQDLSPMQLRMVARRAPTGSVTILGDLAQATGPWWHPSWDDIVEHLRRPAGWRLDDLTLGYRVPGQVIELASRLLPHAAPGVRPTSSVRASRRPPLIIRVPAAELVGRAVQEAEALRAEGYLVGCIVGDDHLGPAERAFRSAGIEHGMPERDGLSRRITLLPATGAKGLEFDAVVVVEPAEIAGETTRGLRLLYVALTRPIQHLTVVHTRDLPGGL